jgi:predicted RNA binding protein YcfA (HicA-like mRNA interferase family)
MPMTKLYKLKTKLLDGSRFRWNELETLLKGLGYRKIEGSGSRVKFIKGNRIIGLHRPHPQREMKRYAIRYIIEQLQQEGDL